jgi:adenine C2-methylase RlmN of 23S rRNA A2503 and tRNA A37
LAVPRLKFGTILFVEKDLKSMTLARLERFIVELGQKKYNAGYIFGFIHTRGITDISGITPMSKPFRSRLVEDGYYISKLEVIDKLTDPDGTVKYVFGLPDEKRVESVLLFDDDRRTLCVSTQVGCAMGCVFCATGQLGLARNLTTAQIVDQVNMVALDSGPAPRRGLAYGGRPEKSERFPGLSPGNSKGISQGALKGRLLNLWRKHR